MDEEVLDRAGISFNSNFILGANKKQPSKIYKIIRKGMPSTGAASRPSCRWGSRVYGSRYSDRVFTLENHTGRSGQAGIALSTLSARSNLSVGTLFEMFAYRADSP